MKESNLITYFLVFILGFVISIVIPNLFTDLYNSIFIETFIIGGQETGEVNCAAVGDLGTGVVADNTNSDGCATDTVLNTFSDTTCDVKCDISTHVAQTATVTCASDANADDAPTGLPTCVPRAACDTITCAAGTSANSSAAALLCAGDTCDNSTADNALCCNENRCAAVGALGTGVVADNANSDGCATDTVLTTDSDSTCEVKCDTATHVAQTATVECSATAAEGDAVTGLPTCIARAACSSMTCAAGTSADSSATASLCAGATCDNTGADNELCCNVDVADCSQLDCTDPAANTNPLYGSCCINELCNSTDETKCGECINSTPLDPGNPTNIDVKPDKKTKAACESANGYWKKNNCNAGQLKVENGKYTDCPGKICEQGRCVSSCR